MVEQPGCGSARALMPELAAGVAYGDERAEALGHVATCLSCRRELDGFARVVDDLMLLAPEREPPAGFEAAVLARIAPRSRRRRLTRTRAVGLAAAAAVLLVAVTAGVTARSVWSRTSADRELAGDYRRTLAIAGGHYLAAAPLRQGNVTVGHVFAYEGSPSWVFLTVEGVRTPGAYQVRLLTDDQRELTLGTVRIANGTATWGTDISVSVARVRLLELSGPGPALIAPFS